MAKKKKAAKSPKARLPFKPPGRTPEKYVIGTVHNRLEIVGIVNEWMRKCRCLKCGTLRVCSTTFLHQGGRCAVCHPKTGRVGRPPKKKAAEPAATAAAVKTAAPAKTPVKKVAKKVVKKAAKKATKKAAKKA